MFVYYDKALVLIFSQKSSQNLLTYRHNVGIIVIERETAERKNGLAASKVIKQSPYESVKTLRRLLSYCTGNAKIANNTIITSNATKIPKKYFFIMASLLSLCLKHDVKCLEGVKRPTVPTFLSLLLLWHILFTQKCFSAQNNTALAVKTAIIILTQ